MSATWGKAMWSVEQQRIWSPPATKSQPALPKPVAVPPSDGETRVIFVKSGHELPGGGTALAGDEINLRSDDARLLILRGVADFAVTRP
jgi:hypothetical protein